MTEFEIIQVQELMKDLRDQKIQWGRLSKKKQDLIDKVQRGLARYLPSPSLLNAGAILLSNPANIILEWVKNEENR